MNGLVTAGGIALAGLAVAAWLWHAVTEHHVHLVIARMVSPSVTVPPTRHDTMWHGLSHGRRLAADAAIVLAAACTGAAWRLAPAVTLISVVIACAAVIVLGATKSLGRVIGARPRPGLRRRSREGP